MVGVFRRNPLVVAPVFLHVVVVFFFVKLTFHAKVGCQLFVGGVVNIGHVAGRGAGLARFRRSSIAAAHRCIGANDAGHLLAGLDHGQIPVVVGSGEVFLQHIVPVDAPRTQEDIVGVFIVAVYVVAVDVDHVGIIHQPRVNDPVRMLQRDIGEPAALGHQGAVLAGSLLRQADRRFGHGLILGVILVPEGDGAHRVVADINDAADIPPCAVHAFIIACTVGHHPPAVPGAVPPAERVGGIPDVAGILGHIRQGHAVCGGLPAECGRVHGDLAVLAAQELLKSHFDRVGGIQQPERSLYLQGLARGHIHKLVADHLVVGLRVGINGSQVQGFLILDGRFRDAPHIGGAFLAVVGKVQRHNKGVDALEVRHDAGAFVKQCIVAQLHQVGVFVFARAFAAGSKTQQHCPGEQQAYQPGVCPFHTFLLRSGQKWAAPPFAGRPGPCFLGGSGVIPSFGYNCRSCR